MSPVRPPAADPTASLPPAHRAWSAVMLAYQRCEAVLTQRLAALGLKPREHEVLVNLLLYPGVSQQELAAHSMTPKSVISVLVNKLAQAGRLQRRADDADARVWRLHLTPSGQALARRALALQVEVVQAMSAGIDAQSLRQLEAAARRASDALARLPKP